LDDHVLPDAELLCLAAAQHLLEANSESAGPCHLGPVAVNAGRWRWGLSSAGRISADGRRPTRPQPAALRLWTWMKSMSRAGDGPRLAAMCDAATVYFQDLEHEERWPFYAQAAAAGGVRSVLVVPVPLDDYTRAALTFYSALSCAFARHPMSS